MRRGRNAAAFLVAFLATMLTACAPTARTAGPYHAKAVNAVEALRSAVESDRLVVLSVRRGHTLAAYVSVATSEAEDDASSAASSFLSIQPPGKDSEKLRNAVSDLIDEVSSVLGDVRVAGRRGDRTALAGLDRSLSQVAARLDRFLRVAG